VRTARAVSAGGVVLAELRPDAAIALVARRSARGTLQWTLPKGQQEAGETVPETAVREVREETGLEVELIGPLDTIDYWFVWAPEQTRYHKFVHYFLMRATGGDLTRHDHEMEDAAWFSLDRAQAVMAFPNERRLLDLIPDALRAGRERGPTGDGQRPRGSGGLKERSGSPPVDDEDASG
jgi:8-oxo-dGTP pyrophosphatase MutT (NUDIX family)